ncbi:HAMP domain-containing sensor histidine kinase [Dactylosporangium matsuzakiense]|uniref:histidine kinase n=1 Tax=Dactylosporangium matsuzakiense TaxID=53360 RepID=A0A9W6NN90_9ACTN|nr:HAMP domain-containing sensor histidine kinase [Dactylosporangium matsuzakiense]UWZ43141.1 HAMP domain-containing histidine kinase [Dactylosporangium matsuzakiense]GLL02772.1 two-component sensor histidine kinase [Dactylosporangium matsuzakiense]
MTGSQRVRRWSLRTRLAVIAGLALAVTAVAVCAGAWLALRQSLLTSADRDLDRVVQGPVAMLDEDLLRALPPSSPLSNTDLRIQLLSPDGSTVRPAGQPGLPVTSADSAVAAGRADSARHTVSTPDGRYRVLTLRRAGGTTVQVGRSLRADDGTLRRFGLLMAGLAAFVAAGAALAGQVVAATGLRPINRLTTAATAVAATQDLQQPIDTAGDDEIARLAQAFNTMLAALQTARQAQQRLVEDAAHELRTPMTGLHTNLELLLKAGDRLEAADRDNLLRDLRAQSRELDHLVRELVTLARADAAEDPATDLDLADLAAATVERARARTPDARFELTTAPTPVHGRPAALERMVLNLLDNAVKFGPPGGPVHVRVTTTGEASGRRAELTVADHGPGIDPAERGRVFDRFHRGSTATATPGSGLGLAIVAQVVHDHGGGVGADERPGGGALFRVWLPPTPAPPRSGDP